MSPLLFILSALLLYRPLHYLLFFYWDLPKLFYTADDPYGFAHLGWMERLDQLFFYRYFPVWLFASATFWVNWPSENLQLFGALLLFLIGWPALTADVDLATGNRLGKERLQLLTAAFLALLMPSFIAPFLTIAVNSLRAYDHHSHVPIRTLFLILVGVLLQGESEWVEWLALYVIAAHYFVPGVAKLKVAKSWIKEGRLDLLPKGSYLWGWMRFISPRFVNQLSLLIKPFSKVTLFGVLLIECLSPLLFLTPFYGVLLLLFHLGFFLLSGALFWQLMGVLFGVFLLKSSLSPLYGLLLLLPPFKPEKLVFWFTAFVQRIDWVLIGVSGKRWGLYNDFMSPNERLYGLIPKCFYLAPYPLLTTHSGETERVEVAEALHESVDLKALKERMGISYYDAVRLKMHLHYLDRFFQNFNRGVKKHVVPWWLKAPGSELSYWGTLPRFRGEEKIREIEIYFREERFEGEEPKLLTRSLLATLSLPQESHR